MTSKGVIRPVKKIRISYKTLYFETEKSWVEEWNTRKEAEDFYRKKAKKLLWKNLKVEWVR